MSFVAAATTVGTWAGFTSATGALIGGSAIIGAGVGGAYSALTGDGKILDSMLTGAALGGLGGWGLSAAGAGATTTVAPKTTALSQGALGTQSGQLATATNTPALAAYGEPVSTSNILANQKIASGSFGLDPGAGSYGLGNFGSTNTGFGVNTGLKSTSSGGKSLFGNLSNMEKLGYGLGATTLLGMLGGQEGIASQDEKGMIRPYEYSTAKREPAAGESYYFEPIQYDQFGKTTKPINTAERNYFDQKFTALPTYAAANGGQVPQLTNMPAGGLASIEGMRDGYGAMQTVSGNIPQFAMGGIPRLSNNKKMATVDEYIAAAQSGNMNSVVAKAKAGDYNAMIAINKIKETPNQNYASGGFTNMQDGGFVVPADTVSHFGNGSTDAGLKLLSSRLGAKPIKGGGDGMSDSIPAMINGKQPARIADGEAYVPPEMVKKIGKGSSEAGAKRLYNMMDKVRHARTGTKKQGKQIKADKYLPT